MSQADDELIAAAAARMPAPQLPTGAATEAMQEENRQKLEQILEKLEGPLAVTGPLTAAELSDADPMRLSSGAATAAGQDTLDAHLTDGSARIGGTVAVSGPLTDAQLRATPVAISGSFSIPAGGATSAKQDALDAHLTDGSARIGGTVAVSGPVTDTQLRATALPVSGPVTDTQLRATALPVSAAALPLPSGAATSAKQDAIDGHLTDGSARIGGTVAVSGPVTDTQLRATALPVSAAALPLPTGAATAARQDTIDGHLTDGSARIGGTVAVTGPATDAQLRATALPVSGPLTDTQLRATALPVSNASLPLPSGAATETTLATLALESGGNLQFLRCSLERQELARCERAFYAFSDRPGTCGLMH